MEEGREAGREKGARAKPGNQLVLNKILCYIVVDNNCSSPRMRLVQSA